MRICLLSYQASHRKTYDVLAGLKAKGYKDVCVYAKTLHYIKKYKPIIEHRPSCECTIYDNLKYEDIIRNYNYELRKINNYEEISEPSGSVFLVCGAGILPNTLYKNNVVINAHPGYIPNERGLDALKWAIIEEQPIGVTTHLIGDYVDAGCIISRKQIRINNSDTFHAVSQRVYFLEIKMLIDAIEQYKNIEFYTDGEGFVIHKRMPSKIEKNLIEKFENIKTQKKED